MERIIKDYDLDFYVLPPPVEVINSAISLIAKAIPPTTAIPRSTRRRCVR